MSTRKYGRTFHLPFSKGFTSDDKVLKGVDQFKNRNVVITEKMDGENCTIHSGGTHARSMDGKYHPSRDWVKAFAANISLKLDDNERIVGEYLYAKHSIGYDNLETYFMGFAWSVDGIFQSWEMTKLLFEEYEIKTVPVLYEGMFYDGLFEETISKLNLETQEGFVIRLEDAFGEDEMHLKMGKFVREKHVQTDKHWMFAEMVKNGLKS